MQENGASLASYHRAGRGGSPFHWGALFGEPSFAKGGWSGARTGCYPGENGAHLHGLSSAATRGFNASSIQRHRYATETGDPARLNLPDDRRDVSPRSGLLLPAP